MSITDRIFNIVGGQKSALKLYYDCCRRAAAADGKPVDDATWSKVLGDAEKTPSDARKAIDAWRRRAALLPARDKVAGLTKVFVEKKAAWEKAAEGVFRRTPAWTAEEEKLIMAHNEASSELDAVLDLCAELDDLEYTFQAEFGLSAEEMNLDRWTIQTRDTVVNIHDPAAPMRYVSAETFRRENDRRHALHFEAMKLEFAKWGEAVQVHELAFQKFLKSGARAESWTQPYPSKRRPLWSEMIVPETLATLEKAAGARARHDAVANDKYTSGREKSLSEAFKETF